MNPAVFLALGAIAVLAFAGKKKNGGSGTSSDDTTTIPKQTGGHAPPPAESPEQDAAEDEFVVIAVEGMPPNWLLGNQGIEEGVLGIDADGFAYPTPNEWLSGWLTRVAYWGAYQNLGWPLEMPVQCILEATCPEDLMPVRNALLRINESVKAVMEDQGIEDTRF